MRKVGRAIGEELRNKRIGGQIILGPSVNIHRSPLGGRNAEFFSEDPFLTAETAVGYIQGVQSTGAAACVKHFACNNEEVDRGFVNVIVDERTLREIYLPAFEAAVKRGHVRTVMSSYNKVNGQHSSANWYLDTRILRGDWGFDGMVMSDWGGVHEVAGTLNAGNDLEMPGPGILNAEQVSATPGAGGVMQVAVTSAVRAAGGQPLGTLVTTYDIAPDAQMTIHWTLNWTPADIRLWEEGLKFALPAGMTRMAWQRDSFFTDYPAGHLGEPSGTARAGETLFRASRRGLHCLTLSDGSGAGLALLPADTPLLGRADLTTSGVTLFASREASGDYGLSRQCVDDHTIRAVEGRSLSGAFALRAIHAPERQAAR